MRKFMISIFATLIAFNVNAATPSAEELLEKAKAMFTHRTDSAQLNALISELKGAEDIIQSAEGSVQFQLRYYLGRAVYYKAYHAELSKAERMALYDESMGQFTLAKKSGDFADAYVWYASALGRWAELKGVTESLGRKNELIGELEAAKTKSTVAGAPGETVEGYGPDRILGRIYDKLPFFAGGSRTKAKRHLDVAYENAPAFPINVIYRAEIYSSGSASEKGEACRSLTELLNRDPNTLPANRVPENAEELEDAAKLHGQICR